MSVVYGYRTPNHQTLLNLNAYTEEPNRTPLKSFYNPYTTLLPSILAHMQLHRYHMIVPHTT